MNAPRDAFVIEHLSARFQTPTPIERDQCEAWLHALSAADGEALTAGIVEPEAWLLLRHMRIAMRWRADSSTTNIVAAWQQALQAALAHALAHPDDPAVVHYRQPHHALADLLYRTALGDTTRVWAWQRMGLIPGHAQSPVEVLGHGLKQLLDHPAWIWPVLQQLIAGEAATASLTALLRSLPSRDWHTLLAASPNTAGFLAALNAVDEHNEGQTSGVLQQHAPASNVPVTSPVQTLIDWFARRPHLAPIHQPVITVLAAALGDSAAALSATDIRRRLRAVEGRLPVRPAAPRGTGSAKQPASAQPPAASPTPRADDLPALPALPDTQTRDLTRWGGVLFWLARLPSSPLFEWYVAQDRVSLTSLLRHLGEALGVPDDDPALRALCGGEPGAAWPPSPDFDEARAAVGAQIGAWTRWLDTDAPLLAEPRMATVCHRTGHLRFESGWIELHLPLEAIDTDIRRLGLDLDPGWLPWLGCVVRIIYDD